MKGQPKKCFYALKWVILALFISAIFTVSCKKSGQSGDGSSTEGASTITAIVKSITGKAIASFDGSAKKLARGMEVTNAEYIKTDNLSKVTVLFSTKSQIVIEENSKIAIKTILPKGIRANISKGSILLNVKRLVGEEQLNVSTPTALAGVRGTKFYVSYNPDTKTTRVAVRQGVVNVRPVVTGVDNAATTRVNELVSINLNKGRAISISKKNSDEISLKLKRDAAKIKDADAAALASLASVRESRMLLNKYAGANTRDDRAILDRISAAEETNSVGQASTSNIIKEKKMLPRLVSQITTGAGASTPLYAFEQKVAYVGKDNTLYIVDFSQEQPKIFKKLRLSASVKSVPLQYGGMLYFGTIDKKLYGVNMRNGAVAFTIALKEALVLQNGITASGSDIYLATGVELYRINRFSGAKIWSKNIENGSWAAVAVDGNKIYLGDEAGKVRAFAIANGMELWSKQGGMRVTVGRAFTIDDKVVINMYSGKIKAYKLKDGTPVATAANVGRLQKAPVRHGNFVYYPLANHIKVLNLRTLRVVSIIRTGAEPKFGASGPKLYVSAGSKIKATSLFGQGQDWAQQLDAAVSENPACDDLYVYVLSEKGTLYKLNQRDFIMVERTATGEQN